MHRTSLKAAAAAGFICRSRTMAAILYQRQPFVLARHRVNTLTNLTLFEVTNVNVWISPLVKKEEGRWGGYRRRDAQKFTYKPLAP